MTTTRRRKTPVPRQSGNWQRRRRPVRQKKPTDWTDVLIKFFIVFFVVFDLVLVFFIVRQCSRPVLPPGAEVPVEEKKVTLQVEVLNGCGVSGVANRFTDYLRDHEFDVVRTDNYESFNVQQTVVIDRSGNRDNALRIAKALGLDEMRVLQEISQEFLIDGSVIIGKDYKQLEIWKKMER